jgi:UDP-N-acetyl-D-glucosamine dehydrogenase
MAYKKNVADIRESPSFKLIELIEERGGSCAFHDPHVAAIPPTREHADFTGRESVALSAETLAAHDVVLIATDHDAVDYGLIGRAARLVVDCRNRMAQEEAQAVVVKA